jgi:hypothetical protein
MLNSFGSPQITQESSIAGTFTLKKRSCLKFLPLFLKPEQAKFEQNMYLKLTQVAKNHFATDLRKFT